MIGMYIREEGKGDGEMMGSTLINVLEEFCRVYRKTEFYFIFHKNGVVRYDAIYRGRIFNLFFHNQSLVGEHPFLGSGGICEICLTDHLP